MSNTPRFSPKWRRSSITCATLLMGGIAFCIMDDTIWAQRPLRDINRANPVGQPPDATPLAFRNVARHALPSLVAIEAFGRGNGNCRGPGPFHTRGTGFAIAPDGAILTSGRFVRNADRVRVRLADGSTYLASSADIDPLTDIAVLRFIPALNVPAFPLGDSALMDVGDWVLSVGRTPGPLGTHNEQVSAGVISSRLPGPGVARRDDFFQTDLAPASMSPGSPILDLNGEVVGIQTGLGYDEEGAPSTGWVLPSHLMDRVTRQLINEGRVTRAYLGIGTQPVDSRLANRFGIPANEGALVNQVLPNSPAASAGFQPGDVVQTLNGVRIVKAHQLPGLVDDLSIGKTIPVTVVRSGRQLTLRVAPVELPGNMTPAAPRRLNFQSTQTPAPRRFSELGIDTRDLTPATTPVWARHSVTIGSAARGVIVQAIQAGSPAAEAGLRPGMIIRSIGDRPVNSTEDLSNLNFDQSDDRGILLLVHSSRESKYLILGGDD